MPTPAGFAQVTYHHTGPGAAGDLANVVGFDVATADLTTAQALRDRWQSHMLGNMSSLITFTGATVRFGQDGADDLVYELSPNGALPAAGLEPGQMAPLNVAVLVKKITALGGRRNRGRMYLPGVPEGVVLDTARLSPSFITEWQTGLNDFRTNVELIPATIVILHPARDSYFRRDGTLVPALPAAAPTPVTSLQVQSLVATQRRRIR